MGVGRDILISKTVIFSNYADHAETFSGELFDFRKTCFHESKRGEVNEFFKMATIVVVISHVKKKAKWFCLRKERIYIYIYIYI